MSDKANCNGARAHRPPIADPAPEPDAEPTYAEMLPLDLADGLLLSALRHQIVAMAEEEVDRIEEERSSDEPLSRDALERLGSVAVIVGALSAESGD